jgi:hypothetical protein
LDNYSIFNGFSIDFLGGGYVAILSGMNISPAWIAFEVFPFLEKSPDEAVSFI